MGVGDTGFAPEVEPKPQPISLTLTDGTEVLVPIPLPAATWLWVLERCIQPIDPNSIRDETQMLNALLDGVVVRAAEILSVATGVPLATLQTVDTDAACLSLCAQMGAELRGTSPFGDASVRAGMALLRRKLALCGHSTDSAGSQPPSPFNQKSAVDDGRPSSE